MTPLVIVPARAGSKGVPNKNFERLPDGTTLVGRAISIGLHIGNVVVSTDVEPDVIHRALKGHNSFLAGVPRNEFYISARPAELAQDDTPIYKVIEHVLAMVPGDPDKLIVILNPTTPLRTVEQVRAVIEKAESSGEEAASVRAIPDSFWRSSDLTAGMIRWPGQRQDAAPRYIFSGTAYVSRRRAAFPAWWHAVIEDASTPYVNIDSPEDWEALCALIRSR